MLECIYRSYTRYISSGPKEGLKGSLRIVIHIREELGNFPNKLLWYKVSKKLCQHKIHCSHNLYACFNNCEWQRQKSPFSPSLNNNNKKELCFRSQLIHLYIPFSGFHSNNSKADKLVRVVRLHYFNETHIFWMPDFLFLLTSSVPWMDKNRGNSIIIHS